MAYPTVQIKVKPYRHPRSKRPKCLRWFYIVKPTAATGEFWDRQGRMAKRRHPVRLWLQETYPRFIGRIKYYIGQELWRLKKATINDDRWVHIDTLPVGISEISERMLHASFKIFTLYIEDGVEYQTKLKKSILGLFSTKQDRLEYGLASLDAMIADEDYMSDPKNAENIYRLRRLYVWWRIEREQRIDPYQDDRIWRDVVVDTNPDTMFNRKQTSGERKAFDAVYRTKEFYDDQDIAMLKELNNVRLSLW